MNIQILEIFLIMSLYEFKISFYNHVSELKASKI